jgi:hypothetical protein
LGPGLTTIYSSYHLGSHCTSNDAFIVPFANGGKLFYRMLSAARAEAIVRGAVIYVSAWVDTANATTECWNSSYPTFTSIQVTDD